MKRALVIASILAAVASSGCKDTPPTWAPVWKRTSPLSTIRQGLAAVEVNGFIYVMGGARGKEFLGSSEYAKILEDGSLGPWRDGPPMNETRGYFAAVEKDGYIYVVGGGNGEAGHHLLRSVEAAKILPDGSLSPWRLQRYSMVTPRRCSKAVLIDDAIYALGGFGGDMLDTVEHAHIVGDGETGEWFEEPEHLSIMRYISGVKKVGDIVYVVGSHDQSTGGAVRDAEWSKVVDEAGFDKWQKTSGMVVGRYGLDIAAHNGRLYAIGGLTGPRFVDSIESAPILPGGGLGPWKMLRSKLSTDRAMMKVLTYKDWVYSLGGAGENTVEYATFNEDGEIGSWLTREELDAIEASRTKTPPVETRLPIAGRIVKIMHADPYVYLLVQFGPEQGEWIAAAKGDYRVGERVRYNAGAMMGNFFSKQLGIRFEQVRFVSEIRKEG